MSSENPYTPPEANLAGEGDASIIELASLGQRFGAALIDGLISWVCVGPLMFAFGYFEYTKQGKTPPFLLTLGLAAIGFVIFALVHSYFLKMNGQTVGKKLIGIRIADLNDNVPELPKVLGLRYLPVNAVAQIPVLGIFIALIDTLFIFRSDRRCVHDLIAGTKVVQVKKG